MMDQSALKRLAAQAAIQMLPERGLIGLGTGSTADVFIEHLAVLIRNGRDFTGVPTSNRSRDLAQRLGIPLRDEQGPWDIDVTVDGADEVSATLDVIKGGGASHLREKIVNDSSRLNIIVVDESKLSHRLGTRFPVPVEVVRFGHAAIAEKLGHYGVAKLRVRDGQPIITDSGHLIYDLSAGEILDPRELDIALCQIPGVVETGLFVARAHVVVVAGAAGIRQLRPSVG